MKRIRVGAILAGLSVVAAACGGQVRTVTVLRTPKPPKAPVTATPTTATTSPISQSVPASAIIAAEQAVTPVTCYDANSDTDLQYYEGTAFDLINGDAISASHVVSACGVGAPIELGPVGADGINANGSLANPNTSVMKNDTTNDVAVVTGLPSLPGVEAERIPAQTGEKVVLLGFPGDKDSITAPRQLTVVSGTVTEVGAPRTLNAPLPEGGLQETLSDAIQVTATSEPGESGGLAIDAQGKAVGVIEGSNAEGTVLTPVSDLPLPPSADPIGTTRLTMGVWNVVEPTTVGFSADAGNVVTDIVWSSWTADSAVGTGTSFIQSCIPNCASGSDTTASTTLQLSNPVDGHFTQLIETRNGTSTTWTYPTNWPW